MSNCAQIRNQANSGGKNIRSLGTRGQAMTEYLLMMAVLVGGVLVIGALFKTAIPQVFGSIIGGVATQTDSSEGSTQKAEEAAGGEANGGNWQDLVPEEVANYLEQHKLVERCRTEFAEQILAAVNSVTSTQAETKDEEYLHTREESL